MKADPLDNVFVRCLRFSQPKTAPSIDLGVSLTSSRSLYELQELDWELDHATGEMSSVIAQLNDDSQLVAAKKKTRVSETAVLKLTEQQVDRAQNNQQLKENLEALEKRLYGGSIRNPKELESLHSELEYARQQAAVSEELLLNLMMALDEGEKTVVDSRTELERLESARAVTLTTLNKERTALAEQMELLKARRSQLTSGFGSGPLAQYERVRSAYQGHAVAKVERGRCTGCRIALPTGDLQQARTAKDLVLCGNCGRILYVS